jgi:hypothetical protein
MPGGIDAERILENVHRVLSVDRALWPDTGRLEREDITAKSAAEVLCQHTSTGIPGAHKQDLHNVRWRPIVEVKKRLPLGGPIHAFVVPTQEVDAGRISRRSWKDHRRPV